MKTIGWCTLVLVALTLFVASCTPITRPPLAATCVEFSGYADNTVMGQTFSISGFGFTGLGAMEPFVNDIAPGAHGLQFDDAGIRIDLPQSASLVSLLTGSYTSASLEITAFDSAGAVVDRITVAGDNSVHPVDLSGQDITSIVITGGGNEGVLLQLCVDSSPTPEPIGTPLPAPAATATVEAAATAQAEELEAFPLTAAIWDLQLVTALPVCWETPGFETEKAWVHDAVARTWEQESAVNFVDWQQCAPSSAGIRITISDVGPHVKALGNRLNGRNEGMVLNFTFANWSPVCASPEEDRKFCIEAIAVHEFGHALAFAHEQNRPDAPQWCKDMTQGTNGDWLVTPFDLDSIMNYCNVDWNNDGLLSTLDIQAVRFLYGDPPSGRVTVRRSDGSQFTPNEDWTAVPYYGSRDTVFIDVTGDGLADAIVANE